MADNKQYVLQEREKGNVMISEDVIATIAAHAVSEVEGIAGLNVLWAKTRKYISNATSSCTTARALSQCPRLFRLPFMVL